MKNKVVLITGSAKGIGKAIAKELAKNGYDIVINYLHSKQEALSLQKELIASCGVDVLAIQADVSSVEQVDAMVSEIEEKMGSVDVLVNNAAIDLSNLFHLKTSEEFQQTMNVNVVLAMQWVPYIHVNAIAPGFIGTESELDGYDEEFLKQECEKILVERYGKPEEVAYLVKFLISEEADYINNTIIRIDGGQKGSC